MHRKSQHHKEAFKQIKREKKNEHKQIVRRRGINVEKEFVSRTECGNVVERLMGLASKKEKSLCRFACEKSAINLIRFDWHQAFQIDSYYAYFRFDKFRRINYTYIDEGVKQIDGYERFYLSL